MSEHDETRSSIDSGGTGGTVYIPPNIGQDGGTIHIPTNNGDVNISINPTPESPGSRSNYGEFYWYAHSPLLLALLLLTARS